MGIKANNNFPIKQNQLVDKNINFIFVRYIVNFIFAHRKTKMFC
ncbi:MAG: hypothetical protein TRG1_2223 [Flavobacteriaceae bacterium FS1-H7996/R]|nr:MAG: hypothetical protein TRG1_2223 [Flavobacteriaceae bacterium FS1-H7996/R]